MISKTSHFTQKSDKMKDGGGFSDVRCLERARGGIKYEILLSETPILSRRLLLMPRRPGRRRDVSLQQIRSKLEAAERRRLQHEGDRRERRCRWLSHVKEVQSKKVRSNQSFVMAVQENLDQKMRTLRENRDAYLRSVQKKNRDQVVKALETNRAHVRPDAPPQPRQQRFRGLLDTLSKQDRQMGRLKTQIDDVLVALTKVKIKKHVEASPELTTANDMRREIKKHVEASPEVTTTNDMRREIL